MIPNAFRRPLRAVRAHRFRGKVERWALRHVDRPVRSRRVSDRRLARALRSLPSSRNAVLLVTWCSAVRGSDLVRTLPARALGVRLLRDALRLDTSLVDAVLAHPDFAAARARRGLRWALGALRRERHADQLDVLAHVAIQLAARRGRPVQHRELAALLRALAWRTFRLRFGRWLAGWINPARARHVAHLAAALLRFERLRPADVRLAWTAVRLEPLTPSPEVVARFVRHPSTSPQVRALLEAIPEATTLLAADGRAARRSAIAAFASIGHHVEPVAAAS